MESGVEQRQMLVEKVLNPIRIEQTTNKSCSLNSVGLQYLSLYVVVNSDMNYLREFLLSLILNLILIEFS